MNPLVESLGWTLLHFLWQGAAIALLLAIGLRLLRRQPSSHRYLAGCAALAFMVIAPAITFHFVGPREQPLPIYSIEPVSFPSAAVEATPHSVTSEPKIIFATKPPVPRLSFARRLEILLPWLVVAWAVGVLALSCRLLAGWVQIKRLQRNAIETLAEPWHQKLAELAQRLNIDRPLRLFQSALIEVPTVIGWLRPVILLPASCLAGLTPGQLESILAHELAHIRRHDYLVNLLQSMVETLLFYHPAVWWVSRRIREERENCCDDIAVKTCGDPIAYARALATLEELRLAPAQLALAASGAPLLQRVQRLLGKSARSASPPAWPLAGVFIAIMITALATNLHGSRTTASDSMTPKTFLTGNGNYHYTNNNSILELTIRSNHLLLGDSDGSHHASAGVNTWNPGRHWFLYFAKDLQVWAYDGNRGLWLLRADAGGGSGSASIEWLRERPPAAVEKRLPPDVIKALPTSLETREFRLNPGNLTKALEKAGFSSPDVENHAGSKSGGGNQVNDGDTFRRSLAMQIMIRQFFFDLQGIDIPLDTIIAGRNKLADPKAPLTGKTLYYDERAGRLLVRSTSQELEKVSSILADINKGKLPDTGAGTKSERFDKRPPQDSPGAAQTKYPTNGNLTITFTPTSFGPPKGTDSRKMNDQSGTTTNKDKTAQTPSFHEDEIRIAAMVQEGKLLFEAGKLDEAEAKLNRAYQEGPSNDAAYHYLQIIRQKRMAEKDEKIDPKPDPYTRNKQSHLSKGRQAILSKLDRIRIDTVKYDSLPLVEVINYLNEQAKLRDPDRIGINFFIDRETAASTSAGPSAIDSTTGLPKQPSTNEPADITKVMVTIKPALTDIRLGDLLDAITKTADKPIKFSIYDYAIGFSLRGQETVPLETRRFHVDPGAFRQNLERVTGIQIDATNSYLFQIMLRTFFSDAGVFFPTNTAGDHTKNPAGTNNSAAGKAIFFNNRAGELFVRATSQDLDIIASALETINSEGRADAQTEKNMASGEVRTNPDASSASAKNESDIVVRVYRLDMNTLFESARKTNQTVNLQSQSIAEQALQDYFTKVGITFPSAGSVNARNPNSYILDFRTKTLAVRARKADMDKIDAALARLGPRPLINIKVKFVEIDETVSHTKGFDWLLKGSLENRAEPAPKLTWSRTASINSIGWPNRMRMTSNSINLQPLDLTNSTDLQFLRVTNSFDLQLSGILAGSQFPVVLETLKQRNGVDELTMPEITTESGRQAELKSGDIRTVVVGPCATIHPQTENIYSGPTLAAFPVVLNDGYSIEVKAIATVTEFLGYEVTDKRGKREVVPFPTKPEPVANPVIRLRQMALGMTVHDGETIVLGGLGPETQNVVKDKVPVLGDIPLVGRLFRSQSSSKTRRNLLVFITPTIVNPDGSRYHSTKDLAGWR